MVKGGVRLIALAVTLLLVAISGTSTSVSFAQDDRSETFSPDDRPYGKTYSEWTENWWQWFLSIPADENPINDSTGEKCLVQQSGPVVFLVGSGGGTAERSCTITSDKAILIPSINVICTFAEDESIQTEEDARACANGDQDLVTEYTGTLDGSDVGVHRVDTSLFDVTFPPDNVFGIEEGDSQGVSDGYWVFLKPLREGSYELRATGLLVDYTVTGPVRLVEDSTYHLTVESSQAPIYAETVAFADKSFDFPVSSASSISDLSFDEEGKQLSFAMSGASAGMTSMPISWLLEGPYTVMIDNEVTDHDIWENPATGETMLMFTHDEKDHDIEITGTNVVPEFPYAVLVLLVAIGTIIGLTRTGHLGINGFGFNRNH